MLCVAGREVELSDEFRSNVEYVADNFVVLDFDEWSLNRDLMAGERSSSVAVGMRVFREKYIDF